MATAHNYSKYNIMAPLATIYQRLTMIYNLPTFDLLLPMFWLALYNARSRQLSHVLSTTGHHQPHY